MLTIVELVCTKNSFSFQAKCMLNCLCCLLKIFRMDMVHLPGKGVGARRVPLIMTPAIVEAMDCLVEYRAQCGILNTNVYFFAVPASHGFVNGWQVMYRIARLA
jgi:hypothetical protein